MDSGVPKKKNRIGWDPRLIAQEVINIFAKYEMPVNMRKTIYDAIDFLLSCQKVMPVDVDKESELFKED